ncbi:LapA family protein [Gordonia sp. SL306]|uniref:LapA family protein n=1 Tax=Gordonia sp. SL306 TaxID=2995145 RepID=UPI00226E4DC4|nr:lipopolysaccharide assembly protein LapA domain-containing protein [Gordonia sp. SL306]WAC55108.1 lipopolysaccharide assembly protein LapA domain-containing protein [Gordonia sp. SL306]
MTTPDPQRPEATPGDLPPADPELDRDHQALLDERDELRTKVKNVEHTRTRATFIGLVIGAVITVLLLVFILQNLDSQRITLIFWEVNLPLGVSLLIAAIAGALIVALAGGLRMLQMSRAMRKAKK